MRRSTVVFLIIAVAIAAGCIRLGFWQLDRRKQRQAVNAQIASRMGSPARPVAEIEGDTTTTRFAMTTVRGTPDFGNEILLTHRGHDGAPGVDLLTPIRIPGQDSVVLVNRGWVYSPDGMHIEIERWREPATSFTGYIESFASVPADTVRDGRIRRASYEAIARALPYPIRRFYVVALADSADQADSTRRVIRLARPELDEGPHLSYALQWFSFATIALVGAGIAAARSMR